MKIIDGKAHRYVKFLVYGCQMNVADAERMAGQLADIGYERLSEGEKERLTDACKIMVLSGVPVHMIQGDAANIKITYAQDLRVAEALLG